jgi:hypothetical protein
MAISCQFRTKFMQICKLQDTVGCNYGKERNVRGSMVASQGIAMGNRTLATKRNYSGGVQGGDGKKVS